MMNKKIGRHVRLSRLLSVVALVYMCRFGCNVILYLQCRLSFCYSEELAIHP
jgi:hypothetical protein